MTSKAVARLKALGWLVMAGALLVSAPKMAPTAMAAAKAIAETILISLLAAEAGETWMLSSTSAWCRRAAALCTQDYAAPGEL